MKTHEIKTEKGEFVAVDLPIEEIFTQDKIINAFIESNNYIQNLLGNTVEYKLICKLSEATEEDAKGVVDEHNHYFNDGTIDYSFRDYRVVSEFDEPSRLPYALKSLHSLLRSKGIDINNGNWYLFKKI